jgi:chromosome segregation ATPase
MALFLKFPASSLQKAEEDLLNWVDEYCNENLLKRLQEAGGGEAAPDAPTRAIYKAIDAALVPHHAELRAWEARLREIGKSLTDELTRGWAGIQQDLQGQHAERVTQLQELLTKLADTSQLQSAAIGQLQELQHVQVEHGTAAVQAMSDQVAAIQRQAEEHRARLETTGTQFLEQARQAVAAVAEQGQAAHQQLAQSVQESAAETALAATALGDHFGLLRQAVQNLNEVLGQLDGKQVVIQTTGRPGRWWNPFGRGR